MKIRSLMLWGCLAVWLASGIALAQTDAAARRLQWFRDAKFGMFIHFGVQDKAHFNPDFTAAEWARVARRGGARYVVLTTKHHVGFCLWDSALTDWNVVDQTPYGRDIVKDLYAGCQAEGLEMGCYYSIADYHHPLYEPKYQNRPHLRKGTKPGADINEYIDSMFGQIRELCELYHPCLIWFDGGSGFRVTNRRDLLRRRQMVDMLHSYGTIANSRLGDDDALEFVDYLSMNDNMGAPFNLGIPFESAVCMGESWNYRDNDTVKPPRLLLEKLVRAVGNGGNLLLNVGPDQNGVIPRQMQERLAVMGDWLKKNGQAIYGTEAGPYPYEISWGAMTQRRDGDKTHLYLHVVDWPEDGHLRLFGLNNEVLGASLLASGQVLPVASRFEPACGQTLVTIDVPRQAPDPYVSVIELVVVGAVSMDGTYLQCSDGKVCLDAYHGRIHDVQPVAGKPARAIDMKMFTVPESGPGIMPGRGLTVAGFGTKGQALSWDFRLFQPGTYEVVAVYHANKGRPWKVAGRLRAHVAGQTLENRVVESRRVPAPTMNDQTVNLHAVLGTVRIEAPGTYGLTLEVASDFTGDKGLLRSVMLVPVR